MITTQEGLQKQLTETIQIYFNRIGIKEKANIEIVVVGMGRLSIELNTPIILNYEQLKFINNLVHMLMPLGLMYELVHVMTDQRIVGAMPENDKYGVMNNPPPKDPNEPVLLAEELGEIPPEAYDALKSEALPSQRVFANIDTSDNVYIPHSKRKKK